MKYLYPLDEDLDFNPTFGFKGLDFVQTSSASPEQYDVFDNGEPIAYVRLRWGSLTVTDVAHHDIYMTASPEGADGIFVDYSQREDYLNKAAVAILKVIDPDYEDLSARPVDPRFKRKYWSF